MRKNCKEFIGYHGTGQRFQSFEYGVQESVYNSCGFHFMSDPLNAGFYGDYVVQARLEMCNPMVFDEFSPYYPETYHDVNNLCRAIMSGIKDVGILDEEFNLDEQLISMYFRKLQENSNIDGVIIMGADWEPGYGNSDQLVVMEPEQIQILSWGRV